MGNSRDIIEQNDALTSGQVVDVPDFGISGTQEIPEDRRESSEPDASRRFFDKVAGIIARYSVNTETADFKTILELLKKEMKDLSNIDAIIPLLRSTKNPEWSPEKGDKRVVTWQIVNPTIKDLNDYHLLPSQTDDFMAELHKEIENVFVELGTNAAKMLKTHFKGGVFLVDLERIQDSEKSDEQAAITIFNNKISQLRSKAREILLKHLHFRLKKLEKLKKSDTSEHKTHNERVAKSIEEVEIFMEKIESGETSIDLTFGIEKTGRTPQENYRAIRNAQAASNIANLDAKNERQKPHQPNEGVTDHVFLKEYSDLEMMTNIARARKSLRKKVFDKDKKNVSWKWQQFFILDKKGKARMHPEMIDHYRHIDKYYQDEQFTNLSEEEQNAFKEKIAFFDEYYSTINIVDFLKNFQSNDRDFATYLEYIVKICGILDEADEALKEPEKNEQKLRRLLDKTSSELEVSPKNNDPVHKTIHTMRMAIKTLMEKGTKIIVLGDNKGFGKRNQSAYEQNGIDLLEMIGVDEETLDNTDEDQLSSLIGTRLALYSNSEFRKKMMASDDVGTKYLRRVEGKMKEMLGQRSIIDVDGGDETRAVINLGNDNIPTEEEVRLTLSRFADSFAIRIAAALTTFTFDQYEGQIVPPNVRKQILAYKEFITAGDLAHVELKALERQNASQGINVTTAKMIELS